MYNFFMHIFSLLFCLSGFIFNCSFVYLFVHMITHYIPYNLQLCVILFVCFFTYPRICFFTPFIAIFPFTNFIELINVIYSICLLTYKFCLCVSIHIVKRMFSHSYIINFSLFSLLYYVDRHVISFHYIALFIYLSLSLLLHVIDLFIDFFLSTVLCLSIYRSILLAIHLLLFSSPCVIHLYHLIIPYYHHVILLIFPSVCFYFSVFSCLSLYLFPSFLYVTLSIYSALSIPLFL